MWIRSHALPLLSLALLAGPALPGSPGTAQLTATAPGPGNTSNGSVTTQREKDRTDLRSGRPNIVVIMADDMRADDLRRMPNVRHLLADKGASFSNAFASLPLCCPSRASFLSGQYVHNHGVYGNRYPYGFNAFDDSSTVATDLHRAGYRTALVGKYLNGYGIDPPPGAPARTSSTHYIPPGWSRWVGAPTVREGPKSGTVYNYRRTTVLRGGRLVSLSGQYNTHAFGDISTRIINDWAGLESPFFLYASYLAPHFGAPAEADDPPRWQSRNPRIQIRTPAVTDAVRDRFDSSITAPRGRIERDVEDKPAWISELPLPRPASVRAIVESARQRAEALAVLDREVGRTMLTLRRARVLANTVVIFTSDNGWYEGEHRIQADKSAPYQPAFRVPLIVRGPGIPQGVVRHDPVINIDFAPTFADLASVEPNRVIDGRSFLGIARTGDQGWRRPVLTELGRFGTLDLWIKDSFALTGLPFPTSGRFMLGVRTARYAYFTWATGETELYDMKSDPLQLRSVAGRPGYTEVETRLATTLRDLRDCAGSSCRDPG